MDPQLIAQTRFNFPSKWGLDHKELARGETVEEKDKIRNEKIRKECYKVAAYISRAFSRMQDKSYIFLPYNFK